ncbi:MAG: hypothetical protein EOO20_09235 [Chryseobacterium sp.]|nr:MAG: hypothetical protein EOO20_09235 [Chryseobacterium sp.]
MKIEISEHIEGTFDTSTTTYQYIVDNGEPILIGSVYPVHNEGLFMAFNINPEHQRMGIGKKAFLMAYDKYSIKFDIKYIAASWRIDLEYSHLDDSASSNLTVFNESLANGLGIQESALSTPTGKWATSIGYTHVEILRVFDQLVEVNFHKIAPVKLSETREIT